YRVAFVIRSGEKFGSEFLRHRFIFSLARVREYPPYRQRNASIGPDFRRNLVGRSAYAARPDLQERLHIVDGLLKYIDARSLSLLLRETDRVIHDVRGEMFLPLFENTVDEFRHQHIVEFWIRRYGPSCSCLFSHLNYLGFFAPYLDRPCLRSA